MLKLKRLEIFYRMDKLGYKSLEKIAAALDYNQQYVYQVFNGHQNVSSEMIIKLMHVLNITKLDTIVEYEPQVEEEKVLAELN